MVILDMLLEFETGGAGAGSTGNTVPLGVCARTAGRTLVGVAALEGLRLCDLVVGL